MKRFIIATALTLAAASSAMATTYGAPTTGSAPISSSMAFDIRSYVPNADLSNLTVSQVGQFYALFSKSENLRSGENPAGAIQVILQQNG